MTVRDLQPNAVRAGELYGDFWFNSAPLPVSALGGKVMVIHFWDYACVRSLRVLPYLREWHRKYAAYDLVVIGVHAPRFPFGRDAQAVQRALTRLGIVHPVVTDNEGLIAARYETRVVPAVHLVDRHGFIRFQSTGEGDYAAVEHMIQSLLYETGVEGDLPLPMEPLRDEDRTGAVCYRVTQDVFAGYARGTLGNVEGYTPESVVSYADPGIYIDGRFYLDGAWLNDRNCVRFISRGEAEGRVVVPYHALEVNAVLGPGNGRACELEIWQDDAPLDLPLRGDDTGSDAAGHSVVRIREPRVYSLVRNREFGDHVLRLATRNPGCSVFSFMFVSGVIPELVSDN